ncbi:MAG: DUF2892 domain-containing protein [Anaerolineaceae bacterium]|nr:DUF2892 domain-containing protein [Anaerolineaceae bacterium]
MKNNMSNLDRIIRAVVGVVLLALYFGNVVTGVLGFVFIAFGAIMLITAAIGFCPLYVPFKFSTKK